MSAGGRHRKWGSFVVRDERGQLLAAFAELVAKQGYGYTTVEQIVERAGVERAAFDRWFEDLEACFLAAYDAALEQACDAAARGSATASGSWAEETRAALAGLLGFAAGTPAFTHLCAVEALYLGERGLERRERAVELLAECLEPRGEAVGGDASRTPLTAEMIAGGIFEVIRAHAVEGRATELPAALPLFTILALTPFVGRRKALSVAAQPPPL